MALTESEQREIEALLAPPREAEAAIQRYQDSPSDEKTDPAGKVKEIHKRLVKVKKELAAVISGLSFHETMIRVASRD